LVCHDPAGQIKPSPADHTRQRRSGWTGGLEAGWHPRIPGL